jgi:hypothetical protein
MRNASKISVRKLEGKRPLGRSKHRWEIDIKMDLEETDMSMWTEFIQWWVLVKMVTKMTVFWDVVTCSLVEIDTIGNSLGILGITDFLPQTSI